MGRRRKDLRVRADVDGPLVLRVIRPHNAVLRSLLELHAACDARAGGDGAFGVVELVDYVADVRGELGGADVPVNDFGVGVAEC